MKAFVCDRCGKVMLLQDDRPYYEPENGVYRFTSTTKELSDIDLCMDCYRDLVMAVRETKMDGGADHG